MTTTVPRLRKALKGASPGLRFERELWDAGAEIVVGIDEVGRGAWAGPLTVGAAIVPKDRRIYKLRDSKMLTEVEREALFKRIAAWCEGWAIGHASHQECDELGMSDAQRLAADRALASLGVEPDRVLLDGRWDFVRRGTTKAIVRGRFHLALHCGRFDPGQGHKRSHHARSGGALSVFRLRRQQGLSVSSAQGRAPGVGSIGHSPQELGVHGLPSVDGCAPLHTTQPTGIAVRS